MLLAVGQQRLIVYACVLFCTPGGRVVPHLVLRKAWLRLRSRLQVQRWWHRHTLAVVMPLLVSAEAVVAAPVAVPRCAAMRQQAPPWCRRQGAAGRHSTGVARGHIIDMDSCCLRLKTL